MTASTTCTDATVLADERWYPYTVHTEGSKMRLTASLAAVQHDGPTGYSTDFACYQVQARNGTTVVGTSSALHLAFGENGVITAINGTTVSNSGQSDPLANLPAEVTLSTSPTTVREGTAVTVTATLSRSLSAAVTIPLTVTRGTSEDGNHGTLSAITITGGSLSGSGTITTTSDGDGDDETFTVAVTTANLPSGVSGGSPVSKTVTITDIHEGEVSTDPIFPSAPATFTAQAGDWQVVLSWGGVLLATGWEYSKDNGATWSTTGSASTGTTVTGLTNGTSYSFKVRAVRQLPAPFPSQTGRASSTASATPVAGNAPTGQPTVSGTERVGHVLAAATSGIADEDGLSSPGWTYQWVRVEEGSTNTNITSATSATYTLAAADAGKKVRVKVSFTDDGNTAHTLESVDSGVIAAAHTAAPEPVAAVNVTHKGNSLEVSWNAPARATHYDVTYSGGGVNARAAWNREGTSITITCDSREGYENQNCVSGGTVYTVGVRARNAVGTSAWVNSASTADTTAPTLAATNGATSNGTTVTLAFNENLATASGLPGSAFTVKKNGGILGEVLSSEPTVSGKTVTLTLATAALSTDTFTLSYAKPSTTTDRLRDAANNEVGAFTDQTVTNKTADTTAPTLVATDGITVNGTTVTLTFNENLATASGLGGSAFTVKKNGGILGEVLSSEPTVSGKTVTLTLDTPALSTDTFTLSYAKPSTTTDRLRDAANNEVTAFSDQTVANKTADTTAPTLVATDGITVNGTTLTLTFNENLATASGLPGSAFTVKKNGGILGEVLSSEPTVSGKTVTLTLATPALSTDTFTLSYAKPSTTTDRLRDAANNEVTAFSDQTVANKTAATTAPDPVAAVNITHKGSSLTVSWAAPARATHYDVTYSGGGVNARAAWNRAGTSITITCDSREGYENQHCISGGTAYTVAVRARNAVGTSAWVNSAQAMLAVPEAVASVTAVHKGSSLVVTWPEAERADSYHVTYTDANNIILAVSRGGYHLHPLRDQRCGTLQDLHRRGACQERGWL